MRLNIKYKLFFLILSAHALVYVAMYSVGYYYFKRGFVEYVSRIEERQVPALIKGLENFYRTYNSWETMRRDINVFQNLIRQSIENSTDPGQIEARRRRNPRPVPGGFSPNDWYYSSEYSPARPYLQLLDADKKVIRQTPESPPPEQATLNSIVVEGRIVGYLAVTSAQQLSEQGDELFVSQQQSQFLYIAVGLGLLTALLAFPAATILTRPVRQMVGGARALTSGNYASRIPIQGNDELAQLSEDFNTLAANLQQNQKARQQWIADISHELRTPLAILQGELEAVQDGVRPLNANTLDSLHQEVVHLNTLVNDLHELSLSDMGALNYKKEVVDLADILQTSLDKFDKISGGRLAMDLEITSSLPDESLPLIGDYDRLLQLFDNLLQNTLRYTDDGGKLQIRAHDDGRLVMVEWLDSAPGVSDVDLTHLFDRLYRVELSRNRAKGGSGLGLTICQNIVNAHNGTIAASHSPLGGLRLTLSFPRTIEQPE